MKVVRTVQEVRAILKNERSQGHAISFVPTMGALHEGHFSLVRKSLNENPFQVMSIFVNPLQFGPNEDLEAYPRTLESDKRGAQEAGVDLLFVPSVPEMYPKDRSTYVEETSISKSLCGAFRPAFFRGVTTVVLKLLEIVRPDHLYMGEKDAQQLRVIEKMIADLCLETKVIGCPTVREKDGLAMSSRNAYLSPEEREIAPTIYSGLRKAESAFRDGEIASEKLTALAKRTYEQNTVITIQYLELRRWRDFQLSEKVQEKSVLAVAAHIGKTRLIDNIILRP